MKFTIANLGQTVLRYSVPTDIIAQLKNIYRDKCNEMPPANPQLIGKINNEKSEILLYFFFTFYTTHCNH